jgi:hypothetical protein
LASAHGPTPQQDPRRTAIRETLDILAGPTFGALVFNAARARGIDEARARALGRLTNGIFDVMPEASTRMLRMTGTPEEGSPTASEDHHSHLRDQVNTGNRNRDG